jgi:hypothetical protein
VRKLTGMRVSGGDHSGWSDRSGVDLSIEHALAIDRPPAENTLTRVYLAF